MTSVHLDQVLRVARYARNSDDFLVYPSAATPEALRACIDAAAAASPQTSKILERVGLLK